MIQELILPLEYEGANMLVIIPVGEEIKFVPYKSITGNSIYEVICEDLNFSDSNIVVYNQNANQEIHNRVMARFKIRQASYLSGITEVPFGKQLNILHRGSSLVKV